MQDGIQHGIKQQPNTHPMRARMPPLIQARTLGSSLIDVSISALQCGHTI
jgi:hypothetical protein